MMRKQKVKTGEIIYSLLIDTAFHITEGKTIILKPTFLPT